jgi:hypothetical protein
LYYSKEYLSAVDAALSKNFVDCFGGPDRALDSFSDIQKSDQFCNDFFLTTGGIRGGSEKIDKFQPRSFNMGLSRKAFEASNGFEIFILARILICLFDCGIWVLKPDSFLMPTVYHKRRIDWDKFSVQVNKFGKARPILNSWYQNTISLLFLSIRIYNWTLLFLSSNAYF